MKFKIATNFIWRVGRGVHHRDSTLPPYGWSSHEVNSQRHFFVPDMTSRASRCKARRQSPSLVPSSKHDPICAMSVQCVHPISVAPRISWTNVAPSSKHGSLFAPVGSVFFHPISFALRISWTNVAPSSKHGSLFPLSVQSKPSVFSSYPSSKHKPTRFPAGLVKTRHFEHERTDLCPAGSIKVGHLEQAPSDLRPACSVKVDSVIV